MSPVFWKEDGSKTLYDGWKIPALETSINPPIQRHLWKVCMARLSLSFPLKTSFRPDPLGPCRYTGFAGGKMLTGRGTRKFHKCHFLQFRVVCCKGKWLVEIRQVKRTHSQLDFVCMMTQQSPAKDRLCLHRFLSMNSFSFSLWFKSSLSHSQVPSESPWSSAYSLLGILQKAVPSTYPTLVAETNPKHFIPGHESQQWPQLLLSSFLC